MHKSVGYLKIIFTFYLFALLCFSASAFAIPFNVVPQAGTVFPVKIKVGAMAQVFYTVTNNTLEQRNNNFVKYLPINVIQVPGPPGTCGKTFDLAPHGQPGDSCSLALNVVGGVNANDPNPRHHLFVCFPGGLTCAGTNYPLNVVLVTIVSITLTPVDNTLFPGNTLQYTALANYSDGTQEDISNLVTWQSSNLAVALISPNGLATTVGSGLTTITATLSGVTGTTTLTVNPIVLQSIAIVPETANANNTQTVQYTAIGSFSNGTTVNLTNNVNWQSSIIGVATINAAGLATAVNIGTTTITATIDGILSNEATLTIANPLIDIEVTPTAAIINVTQGQQFQATGFYFDGAAADITNLATWSSSNTTVATISNTGFATGVGEGATGITAAMDGISSTSATLTVNNPLVSIAISPANATIPFVGTQQYTATGTFFAGPTKDITNSVTWNSSATNAATISATGLATGVAAGSTTITATSGAIMSGSATLTLKQFLYIANTSSNTNNITICSVDASGIASNCTNHTDLTNTKPIQLEVDRKGTHVYVSNQPSDNKVTVCNIDQSSGNLTCSKTGDVTFSTPKGIAINHTNTRAYIVNSGASNVYVCNINSSTGALSECITSPGPMAPVFNSMLGITLNANDNLAYITVSSNQSSIVFCQVDQSNGTLSHCTQTGSNTNQPNEIALNTTGTFAYIGNFGANPPNILYCAIDNAGVLSGCTSSLVGTSPKGVTISSISKIYFTNFTDSIVTFCTVNANGTLTACGTIPGIPPPPGNPLGISITGHT